MIIVMKAKAKKEELEEVVKKIEKLGYKPHIIQGVERSVIGAVGDERGKAKLQSLEVLSGVDKVVPILKPYKLASRDIKPEGTVVSIDGRVEIGGNKIVVISAAVPLSPGLLHTVFKA
ncbi:MAG: 3-deoxy-7-phosphoheptulonate synthase [bacterium]|nr:MAG: 3-deoxy-7-phosphoheptulonate synthase [bacterium]